MSAQPEITQRDLRNRSKEIMDAVEDGLAFTVTRDGREIGELIPIQTSSSLGSSFKIPSARIRSTTRKREASIHWSMTCVCS